MRAPHEVRAPESPPAAAEPTAGDDVIAPRGVPAATAAPPGAAASAGTAAPIGEANLFDVDAHRLLWRCRRGMKELDVLLERFARRELPSAGAEQRRAFAELLELPDPELADYLLGQGVPPRAELARLAQWIRATAPPG